MASDPTTKPLSFSISIVKKHDEKLPIKTKVNLDDDDNKKSEERDFVTSIDDSGIKSAKPTAEKGPLVIPLIQNKDWKTRNTTKRQQTSQSNGSKLEEGEVITIDDIVRKKLREEAADTTGHGSKLSSSRVIPIVMEKGSTQGLEEEGNFDVCAETPTLDDYEKVPVEEFGMAMLRGMGFDEKEAKKVAPIEVKIRHKGLGLGAESIQPNSSKNAN